MIERGLSVGKAALHFGIGPRAEGPHFGTDPTLRQKGVHVLLGLASFSIFLFDEFVNCRVPAWKRGEGFGGKRRRLMLSA
ncbi:hypothetical protein SAMN04488087_0740 [Rhodothermus profundi]|uniref:Uncharacterized protein n=1 Tax=Rhodothermus profundi TaxID=633813 RepID=A0A1M6R7Z7_9BACT|nr:hypothetical protein SAMN04488087_0740 [Rhodothermus profundi]